MENCRFLRKNKCKFAHALEELRPVPESWTTTKGHYWEPGNPLPDQDILDLIEHYAVSARQLPEWVQYLRAHREEAKQEEDGAPKKTAHREEEINPFVNGEYQQIGRASASTHGYPNPCHEGGPRVRCSELA
jgi:hypothetical protein